MRVLLSFLFILLLLSTARAGAAGRDRPQAEKNVVPGLEFSLHKLGQVGGPTLLVVGGIQGDEPGGFTAATLLTTHYTIDHGAVWIAPNLNFPAILANSRGLNGDLNRKFLSVAPNDPERAAVERIKSIILDRNVDMVLNLHDGSGFYRPDHIDSLQNPRRWGQSVIIDQREIDHPRYGKLHEIAQAAADSVNQRLLSPPLHAYHVKDTRTREGDVEMEKTLSFFGARHLKPAFGVEASKEIPRFQRVYYHLNVVEAFMRRLGIEFHRHFELSPAGVESAFNQTNTLYFPEERIFLDLNNVRSAVQHLPLRQGANPVYIPGSPLMALVQSGEDMLVYHGNALLTHVKPFFTAPDAGVAAVELDVDGRTVRAPLGTSVGVERTFLAKAPPGCRVNVIGFGGPDGRDEDRRISAGDLTNRFSLDRAGMRYRLEVYRDKRFCGMVVVDFGAPSGQTAEAPKRLMPQRAAVSAGAMPPTRPGLAETPKKNLSQGY